ncbi:MAG: hypothetical protein HYX48_07005 [Chlamydiales bacterium]|nr:hypothetical protein [Chlamydiales bacterium]
MRSIIVFMCLVCLPSCGVNQDNRTAALGPLNQMKEFQVVLHAEFDREVIFNNVVESLKHLGSVQIVKISECDLDSAANSSSILISIEGGQDRAEGAIRVFGEVAVQPNQYKTVSQIWEAKDQEESGVYPVLENNRVSFERKDLQITERDVTASAVAIRIVKQFAEQYRKDNPGDAKPVFRVYEQIL